MAKKGKSKNRLGTDKETFILSEQSQQGILRRVIELVDNRSSLQERRTRFTDIDKAMQLEEDKRRQRKEHNYMSDHRPPTMLSHIEAAYAFYVNLFASGEPVFKIVGQADQAEQVKQMQLKINADAESYAYPTTISKALRDALKYDECSLQVEWDAQAIPVFGPSDETGKATIDKNRVEGNQLKYISPFNTFYDENVPHYERHIRGTHVGYFEQVPLVELHQLLTNYQSVGKSVMNVEEAFTSNRSQGQVRWQRMSFGQRSNAADNGLGSLWGDYHPINPQNDKKYSEYSEHYELTTVYMRLIPSMYGINCSDSNRVQIFKFVIVNLCAIVLAERITNVMQYFNIITGQLNDDNIQQLSKSMAELLVPSQNLATELADISLGLVYKAAGDKGIYDSRIISKHDIETRNPTAKIPARPSATGRGLQEAYLPMRADTSAAGLLEGIQRKIAQDASDITGQNNAARGQFQKGNKTLHEFESVMSNADAIKYAKAILLENSFFTPIKFAIRNNILQYMSAGEVRAGGQAMKVNPVELRQAALSFRVADGLKNVERIANTSQLGNVLNMFMQQADVASARGYDVFKGLLRYSELLGVDMGDLQGEQINVRTPAPQAPAAAQTQE